MASSAGERVQIGPAGAISSTRGRADSSSSFSTVGSSTPSLSGWTPAEVALLFSEAVEPRFCTVRVESADGAQVDKGDLHARPDDPRRLAVGLGPLPPGEYRVVWRAISVDTHRTQGRFSFTVAP